MAMLVITRWYNSLHIGSCFFFLSVLCDTSTEFCHVHPIGSSLITTQGPPSIASGNLWFVHILGDHSQQYCNTSTSLNYDYTYIYIYMIGGLEHVLFFHILGTIIPTD